MVIGLSSSGRTPYVVAAVEYARARGAKTAAVTCNHNTPLSDAADISSWRKLDRKSFPAQRV